MAEKKGKSGGGPLDSIEGPVMGVVSSVPVPQLKTWMYAYFHPMDAFGENKKEAELMPIAVHLALIGVLAWVASFLASLLSGNLLVAMVSLIGIILTPIMMILGGFIGSLIIYVIAKILGGKGGFMDQTLALTLVMGGYVTLAFPFNVLGGIPFLGWIFGLVVMLIGLYNIYNEYLVVKGVHQLSTGRAVAVVLIPIIIVVVLAFVFAAAAALAFLSMAGAAGAVGAVPQVPY